MSARRLGLLLALLLMLAAPAPAALPVRAQIDRGALSVAWTPPPGQALACVLATSPDRLLGCTIGASGRYQLGPGSVDAHLRVEQGDQVEVRAWSVGGALLARGRAPVFGRALWLPLVRR